MGPQFYSGSLYLNELFQYYSKSAPHVVVSLAVESWADLRWFQACCSVPPRDTRPRKEWPEVMTPFNSVLSFPSNNLLLLQLKVFSYSVSILSSVFMRNVSCRIFLFSFSSGFLLPIRWLSLVLCTVTGWFFFFLQLSILSRAKQWIKFNSTLKFNGWQFSNSKGFILAGRLVGYIFNIRV